MSEHTHGYRHQYFRIIRVCLVFGFFFNKVSMRAHGWPRYIFVTFSILRISFKSISVFSMLDHPFGHWSLSHRKHIIACGVLFNDTSAFRDNWPFALKLIHDCSYATHTWLMIFPFGYVLHRCDRREVSSRNGCGVRN